MYAQGLGVAQDKSLAHMWLNLAAALGLEAARSARDKLAASMTPEQIAEAAATGARVEADEIDSRMIPSPFGCGSKIPL